VHIGIRTSPEILEAKLERRDHPRSTNETWNLNRLPTKLDVAGPNYLFVAVDGSWRGYFTLEGEILWNPEDKRAPYALVFDTLTWVEIRPISAPRFRGFTYDTPPLGEVVRVE
jgi:hypothetical protein